MRLAKSISFWWAVGLGWAAVEAGAQRHAMNPDGLSYLDMASTGELVNPVWSPLYPAAIRVALAVLRPSGEMEVPAIHLVNFLIFAVALLCFTFFVRSWMDEKSKSYGVPLSFGIFLWIAMETIGVGHVGPDMCVAAAVFLTAGIGRRLTNWTHYAGLGVVLGLGYYAKAAMFPLGLILLAVMFAWPPSGRRSIGGLVLAGVVFLAVAAPLVVAMSRRVGHVSFGEAGKLNYLWHVDGLEHFSGWTGEEAAHAPRILMEKPRVLEFATPVSGTYPLWFDPSYWYEGARVRIDAAGQARAAITNMEEIFFALLKMGALVAGLLILGFAGRGREDRGVGQNVRWIVAWSLAAVATFVVVHVEIRYIAPFLILLWIVAYDFVSRKAEEPVVLAVLGTALSALFLSSVVGLAIDAKSIVSARTPAYVTVARALREAGVGPGDRLASAGYTFDAYYARAAGARVVAEIAGTGEFWRMSAPELAELEARLASVGVKAVVAKGRPESAAGNWKDVATPGGRYSILLLK